MQCVYEWYISEGAVNGIPCMLLIHFQTYREKIRESKGEILDIYDVKSLKERILNKIVSYQITDDGILLGVICNVDTTIKSLKRAELNHIIANYDDHLKTMLEKFKQYGIPDHL